MPSGSDLDRRLASIAGENEWTRRQALDDLRREGLSDADIRELAGRLGEPDATVRASARMALAALASPDSAARATAQSELRSALRSGGEDVRVLAASVLGEAGDPDAGEALADALTDTPNVAAAAADALGQLRYSAALDRIAEVSGSENFWVRAAAIVALGNLEDERAVPTLGRLARDAGLEKPLIEALQRIDHPSTLGALARIHRTDPDDALIAAGRVLSTHPDVEAPDWVRENARRQESALIREIAREDDPAVAHLLGLAATPEALDTLIELIGPPRRSEAAIAGLLAVPAETRARLILDQLGDADRQEAVTLLSLLPPVTGAERIGRLVPLLGNDDEDIRGAAAEALARAPSSEALPLLAAELDREGVAPEVIRALGGLGDEACASLAPLLRDGSAAVRAAAARALTRCATGSVEDDLRTACRDERDPETRHALLTALARAAGGRALDVLDEALESDSLELRLSAIEALGFTGDVDAIPRLEAALARSREESLAALQALGDLARPDGAGILARYVDADDLDLRRTAARGLLKLQGGVELPVAEAMAEDRDDWIRDCAARLLAAHGDAGRPRLLAMAESDPSPKVRRRARQGLGEDA